LGSGFSTAEGTGTMEGRFADTAAIAADAAREHARRAFTLEQLAFRDPVTDLWSRRAFDDRFEELLTDGGGGPLALLMADVDRFKSVNDGHGHEVGDRTLAGVGRLISEAARPEDFVARYGGDEFAVLMPGADLGEAAATADRIRVAVEQGTDPAVTVSIGVGAADRLDRRHATLEVDRALQAAKQTGRNRVESAEGGG
jgi:diguanylate cyclase (GGDEF)-like protein